MKHKLTPENFGNWIRIQRTGDDSTVYSMTHENFAFAVDVYDDGDIVIVCEVGDKSEYLTIGKKNEILEKLERTKTVDNSKTDDKLNI